MCSAKPAQAVGDVFKGAQSAIGGVFGGKPPGIQKRKASRADIVSRKKQDAPAPIGEDEAAGIEDIARREETKKARLRTGRRATILTSPFGVQGQANVRRRQLLGE